MPKLLHIAACILGVVLMSESTHAAGAEQAQVKAGLAALNKNKDERALKRLSVTYDDLHGLHGGLTLTVRGDGRIEQEAVREKVGEKRDAVAQADLLRLVALLVELAAWEQRVPNRPPVPDESRAHLRIAVDGHTSDIWEWYNDLKQNQRIFRVRELLKQIAWR